MIYLVWKGDYDGLTTFLDNINKKHPTIKSDFLISKEAVSFMDAKVYIDNG